MLLFTAAITLASGLFFGLIPVVRFRGPNVVRAIQEGSPRTSSGRQTHFVRSGLVVAQVALALVLLIGSGLMARSFWALRSVDPGFAAQNLVTVGLSLPQASYPKSEDAARFYSRLLDELRTLPGVESVGAVRDFPMTDFQSNNGVNFEDFPVEEGGLPPVIRTNWAAPGYFETLHIPLYEGRTFERRDHEEKTGAVIISRSVSEKYWPGNSALGKRLVPGLPAGTPRWYTVVGVVGDVHYDALEKTANPAIYYPILGFGGENDDWSMRRMTLVVRSKTPPKALSSAIRERVWSLDRNLPLIGVHTGDELLSLSMARTSYTMMLLAIAAGVALFLGSIGIYGVISHLVGQRTREIGLRIALGAARSDVSRMVVTQGLTMTLLGVGLGAFGALAATRMMSALLFGVSATDPGTFVSVAVFLVGVATLASYIPARRAAGIEPMKALYYE